MSAVVKGSVGLAVAVALVSILIAATGLHQNPIVGGLLSIVLFVLLNICVVVWVLKQTREENGYGKQLLNGLLVGVIAGVLVFGAALVMLTVIFPDYIDESRDATIAMLESTGLPEEQLSAQIERAEAKTARSEATSGMIGTFITSVVVAAIAAVFLRKK
jgi:hypothetical protein